MSNSEEPQPILEYATPARPTPSAQIRLVAWIVVCVLTLLTFVAWGSTIAQHGYSITTPYLFAGWIGISALVISIAILLATTPPDAIRLPRLLSNLFILGSNAVLHVACVFAVAPELSDDMLRYRLDARMWADGVSPYARSASSAAPLKPQTLHENSIDRLTPHDYLRTIYPPTAQCVFRAANWLGLRIRPNGSTWYPVDTLVVHRGGVPRRYAVSFAPAMRMFTAAASILTTAILLACLAAAGRSAWYLVLFAWHPLTIIESAGQGHIDIVGVLLVVIAAFAMLRNRFLFAAIALALAAGVKPHVVMLAPVLILAAGRNSGCHPERTREASMSLREAARSFASTLRMTVFNQRALTTFALFSVTLFAVYSPLILNKANFTGWRETAAVYSMTWEANGSIYELLTAPFRDGDGKSLETAKLYARLLGGVGAFMTLYLCIRNRLPFADCAYWLLMIPLLLAPVVYPWYLLWSLAMVPLLQRSRGWTVLVWAATSGLSYQLLREPMWRLPAAWALAEYVPVYLALVFELWSMRSRAKDRALEREKEPSPRPSSGASFDKLRTRPGEGEILTAPASSAWRSLYRQTSILSA